jgi:hypothetical protein
MFGVFLVYKEEIFDWIKSRFTKKRKEISLREWAGADVRIGLNFASNGVVIQAFSKIDLRMGESPAVVNTRVAYDASEIGNEVMALLSEIQLGK